MPKRGSFGSVLPGCRLSKESNTPRSIHKPPLDALHAPAEMPLHLSSVPRYADMTSLVLASRSPSRAAPTCNHHSARCPAGCHTSRDFMPWRFLDAGQLSALVFRHRRHPKTSTNPDTTEHARDVSAINLGIFIIASNYQYVYEKQR